MKSMKFEIRNTKQIQSTNNQNPKRFEFGILNLDIVSNFEFRSSNFHPQGGQSVLEVIVAMAIFGLITSAMISMVTGSFVGLTQGGEQTQAEGLAREGVEAVKAIYDEAWNQLTHTTSAVSVSGGKWVFDGEGTTETIGQFTRTISFADVCRDATDAIVVCPGTYTDVHSQEVTATVTWDTRGGVSNTVERVAYITNWDSRQWTQTDWSGGSGQSVWSDAKSYNTDDTYLATTSAGQATLLDGELRDTGFDTNAGTLNNDWTFTTTGNYTYDGAKIEVTGGNAQLKQVAGGTTGSTTNPDFDTDSSGWIYNDWDQGGGEVNVTGTHNAVGGNLLGWVDVNFPTGKGDELGGYWQQAFVASVDPASALLDFDWQVSDYNGTPNTLKLYVFVDSASGAPTIGQEVWTSGEISSTSGWVSVTDLDVSSAVATAGTYYLKVGVWLETPNQNRGPYEVGYDNVYLDWSGPSFPTDEPTVAPTSSYVVTSDGNWSGFTETASKNGGEIYYQLSDDDGTTWYHWNGTIWTPVVLSTDYNTASVVNANISGFNATVKRIIFRAFLKSDGTQFVKLDNVNIAYTESGSPWSFDTWDVGGGENTPTGLHQTSSGNPGGYNDITVPDSNNDEIGGYWQQSFTNYGTSPTPATLDFDYQIIDFNGNPDVAEIRVYVDTGSGDPTTQVGSAISFSAEGGWVSASQYDLSSIVTSSGIYYLKMAFWAETGAGGGSGPFTMGLDNVVLDLGNGKHPTSGTLTSSAFDMGDSSPVQAIEWDETLPSVTEVVKFEVSTAPDSGGSPGAWSVWYGESGPGTFFANASGAFISTVLNNNQWVRYRTTLTGDGNDTPVLTEVRVNYK
jgi:hypothetical protein